MPAPIPAQLKITWPQKGETIVNGDNRYLIGDRLGQGGFGATYACVDQWNNQLVIKVLVPRGQSYEQVRGNWQREIDSLFKLRHPNITYVFDAFERTATFHIVIERCGGSLVDLFASPHYNGMALILPIARCVLQGVSYIHGNGYVHKDIHVGNVFWAHPRNEIGPTDHRSLTFKLGDLGICRLEAELDFYNASLARWMLPPEFIRPQDFGVIGKPTDIYHMGLLLLSVAWGRAPQFSQEEILAGQPAVAAAQLPAPVGPAIARALQRHTVMRTPNPARLWEELNGR